VRTPLICAIMRLIWSCMRPGSVLEFCVQTGCPNAVTSTACRESRRLLPGDSPFVNPKPLRDRLTDPCEALTTLDLARNRPARKEVTPNYLLSGHPARRPHHPRTRFSGREDGPPRENRESSPFRPPAGADQPCRGRRRRESPRESPGQPPPAPCLVAGVRCASTGRIHQRHSRNDIAIIFFAITYC
jgi:hypothetical protein